MKAYVYHDSDLIHAMPLSVQQIDRARVKLPETFEATPHYAEADIFWIPVDLGHVEAYHGGARAVAQSLPRLPYWLGNERRHVAYFCSDGAEPTGLPCIIFRQSFYKQRRDENAVAWPYTVDDYGALVTDNFESLRFDVSFVGSRVSHKCRMESFDSVSNTPWLSSWLDDSRAHWGSIEKTPLGMERRRIFIESMQNSRMVLAARGGGLSCYRFFEAMSAGRIPILLADDWELPHADLVDWGACILQIAEKDAKNAGEIIYQWMRGKTMAQLAEMGRRAREAWVDYLAPAIWPVMMERCVMERLA